MYVFGAVAGAIALMKCAECGVIMNQGERERHPTTPEGRPIHQACEDKRNERRTEDRGVAAAAVPPHDP